MRQRLIVFHDDSVAFQQILASASAWRVSRVRTLLELERELARRSPEIVVSDAEAHGVTIEGIIRVLCDCSDTRRVLLWLSRPVPVSGVAAIVGFLGAGAVEVVNPQASQLGTVNGSAGLIETLYRLRVSRHAEQLVASSVAALGLAGTPLRRLPALLVQRPWSYRLPSEAAPALGFSCAELLGASQALGFPRSEALLFSVRAELSAALHRRGPYTWPEARETFGELHASNYRRKAKCWLAHRLGDLAGGEGATAPCPSRIRPTAERREAPPEGMTKSDKRDVRSDNLASRTSADDRASRRKLITTL